MAVTLAAVGLALAGVSTIQGMSAAKDQSSAQKRALQFQQRADEVKQNREKRQAIREQRIKAAAIAQAGANQGAVTSSAVVGGQASLQSQLSGNLSFLDTMGSLNNSASRANQQALDAGAKAQTWGALAGLGGTIFSQAGDFQTIFSPGDVKTK